ncbi:DNA repair protein [Tanacetum coccineum]
MKVKITKETKYRRCSKGLARFLNKVRDLYVKAMSELANQIDSGCGPGAVNVSTLPKSFGTNSRRMSSSDQDLSDLVRIAARRGLSNKVESEFLRQQLSTHSQSVFMTKIDEDKACDFDRVDGFDINPVNFSRSRSHVVSSRSNRMS